FIWGPEHFIRSAVGAQRVQAVVDLILMATEIPGGKREDVFRIWVNKAFVPPCAMQVTRASGVGPLTPQSPSRTCGFEQAISENTQCTACDPIDPHCPAGYSCSVFGTCEINQQ